MVKRQQGKKFLLSAREKDVLRRTKKKTAKEVGEDLGISKRTVESHVRNARIKMKSNVRRGYKER